MKIQLPPTLQQPLSLSPGHKMGLQSPEVFEHHLCSPGIWPFGVQDCKELDTSVSFQGNLLRFSLGAATILSFGVRGFVWGVIFKDLT